MHCASCLRAGYRACTVSRAQQTLAFLGSSVQRQVEEGTETGSRQKRSGMSCRLNTVEGRGRGGAHKKEAVGSHEKTATPPFFFSSSYSSQSQCRSKRMFCLSSHTALIVQRLRALRMVLQWQVSGDTASCFLSDSIQLFMVLVSISRGTKQRPMRQPDESVLFMCASVHCAACDRCKKTFRSISTAQRTKKTKTE